MVVILLFAIAVVGAVIITILLYQRFKYVKEYIPPPSRKGSMRLVSVVIFTIYVTFELCSLTSEGPSRDHPGECVFSDWHHNTQELQGRGRTAESQPRCVNQLHVSQLLHVRLFMRSPSLSLSLSLPPPLSLSLSLFQMMSDTQFQWRSSPTMLR